MTARTTLRAGLFPWFVERFDFLFATAAVFVFAGGLNRLIFGDNPDVRAVTLDDSSPARTAILFAIYAITLLLMRRVDLRWLGRVVEANLALAALVTLCLLSVLWSVEPGVSLRRAAAFVLFVAFVLWALQRFTLEELIRIIGVALLAYTVYGFLTVVLTPDIGIHHDARKNGWWHGGFANVVFGQNLAVAVIASAFLLRDRGRWRLLGLCGLPLALLCLYQSHAMTAILATLSALGVMIFLRARRSGRLSIGVCALIAVLIATPAVLALTVFTDEFFALIGRDPSLTDRTRFWEVASLYASEKHPLFGAGYRAFWTMEHSAPVQFMLYFSRETLFGNGHNGYLDLWLEMGWGGVALFVLAVLTSLWRALVAAFADDDPRAAFPLTALVFLLVYSVAEKIILEHSNAAFALVLFGMLAPSAYRRAVPRADKTGERPIRIGAKALT